MMDGVNYQLFLKSSLLLIQIQLDLGNPATSYLDISITVEPRYNEVLGTMKITLLYQVSHYIGVKKQEI